MFNGLFDVLWLKIVNLVEVFGDWIVCGEVVLDLFWQVLVNEGCVDDDVLFDIGIGLECECWLFLVFICSFDYGICVSIVIVLDECGYGFIQECCFVVDGCCIGEIWLDMFVLQFCIYVFVVQWMWDNVCGGVGQIVVLFFVDVEESLGFIG